MMFNYFLICCLVLVNSNGEVGNITKYAPERRLMSPAALEKTKRENQWSSGQISLSTEVGLVIAYDDRYRHMVWFGTEARNSGLEEIAGVNVGHISFGIDGSGKRHGVRGIYCGGIPELFATRACEQIIAVN